MNPSLLIFLTSLIFFFLFSNSFLTILVFFFEGLSFGNKISLFVKFFFSIILGCRVLGLLFGKRKVSSSAEIAELVFITTNKITRLIIRIGINLR